MFGTKKASGKSKVKAEKPRPCGQRPKGLGGPICGRKVRPGWDTCGRPDCAAWKYAGSA